MAWYKHVMHFKGVLASKILFALFALLNGFIPAKSFAQTKLSLGSTMNEWKDQATHDQNAIVNRIKTLQSSNAPSAPCQIELAQLEYQYIDEFLKSTHELQQKLNKQKNSEQNLFQHLSKRLPLLEAFEAQVLVDPKQTTPLARATLKTRFVQSQSHEPSEVYVSLREALSMIELFNQRVTSCSKDPSIQAKMLNSIREKLNDPMSTPLGLTLRQIETALPMLAERLSSSLNDQGIDYQIEYQAADSQNPDQCTSSLYLVQTAQSAENSTHATKFKLKLEASTQKIQLWNVQTEKSFTATTPFVSQSDQEAFLSLIENAADSSANTSAHQLANELETLDGYQRWSETIQKLTPDCKSVLQHEKLYPAILDESWGQLNVPYVSLSTLQNPAQTKTIHALLKEARSSLVPAQFFSKRHSSIAILKDGRVFAWGYNGQGQLGLGDTQSRFSPTEITALRGLPIQTIVVGSYHSIAILKDGRVFAWGHNSHGQLGLGDTAHRHTPTQVNALQGLPIQTMLAGDHHTLALLKDGRMLAWGYNRNGQLGLGDTLDRSSPTEIESFRGLPIQTLSAGDNHTLAILKDGRVYAWGYNEFGQLGMSDIMKLTPTEITSLRGQPIRTVVAGGYHSFAILKDGRVLTWGLNDSGQLGLGDKTNRHTPTENTALKGLQIQSLIAGGYHTHAITHDGGVWAWGFNGDGRLGLGNTQNKDTPTRVPALKSLPIKTIVAGTYHDFAILKDGRIMAWGFNGYGALGLGDEQNRDTPSEVSALRSLVR